MGCIDEAQDLAGVIECVGRLGWEYELRASEAIHGYDGELIAIAGHQASVRSQGGPEATVLARDPYEALLAALIGVQSVLQTWARADPRDQESTERVRERVMEAIRQEQASNQESPRPRPEPSIDHNILIIPAQGPGTIPRREHTSMTDRVLCAYEEYERGLRHSQGVSAHDAQRFADAIQQHLGGTFVPPRGHDWNKP